LSFSPQAVIPRKIYPRDPLEATLFYSLIQSAKLNALNPRVYLHYLLTQIHPLRRKQVNPVDLLPHHINPDVLDSFAKAEHQKALSAIIPIIATA